MQNKKTLIIQETIPHYRIDFFTLLSMKHTGSMVIHSTKLTNDGLVPTSEFSFPNKSVRIYKIWRLHWQPLLSTLILKQPQYLVMGLELKYVSNLLLYFIAPLSRSKVIWWTHGYNVHIKDKDFKYYLDRAIKTFFMKRAHRILLYTDHNKDELISNNIPSERIIVLNNALNEGPFQASLQSIKPDELAKVIKSTRPSGHTLAFIGRLTHKKKSELVLELGHKLKSYYKDLRIFMIGDGEDRQYIEKKIENLGLQDTVFLTGTINDAQTLAPYMKLTDFIVLPGAVGLSIVHSFIYGIPFLTLQGAAHSPEIAYLRSEYNGYMAKDLEDMADWLIKTFDDKIKRDELRSNCLATIREKVNLENMVNNFCKSFED
jgi:L-malate glycosyltransferase